MSDLSKQHKAKPVRPEALHMIHLRLVKARYELESLHELVEAPSISLSFGYKLEMRASDEERFLCVLLKCEIRLPDDKELGKWYYEFIFLVEDLDDHLIRTSEHEEPQIAFQLATTLVSISFSTLRGLFWHETLHAMGEPLILPVIDPVDFVKTGKLESETSLIAPPIAR